MCCHSGSREVGCFTADQCTVFPLFTWSPGTAATLGRFHWYTYFLNIFHCIPSKGTLTVPDNDLPIQPHNTLYCREDKVTIVEPV